MRRTLAAVPASASAEPDAGPVQEPVSLRTEFAFELPRGYVDEAGTLHRSGTMRLATAATSRACVTSTKV